MNGLTKRLVSIGMLILSIVSLVGLGYLTKMAWKKRDAKGEICMVATKNEALMMKIFLVLMWVQIASALFYSAGHLN